MFCLKRILEIRHFLSPYDQYNHFIAKKVGGACSHLGAISPTVGGALAPPTIWLTRPCSGHTGRAVPVSCLIDRLVLSAEVVKALWSLVSSVPVTLIFV